MPGANTVTDTIKICSTPLIPGHPGPADFGEFIAAETEKRRKVVIRGDRRCPCPSEPL
jgi:hypothetical protein